MFFCEAIFDDFRAKKIGQGLSSQLPEGAHKF